MKFIIATISSLALSAAANPVALTFPEGSAHLGKRSGETMYLANSNLGYSEMAYYSNGANSQDGQQPDDVCDVTVSGDVTWEGQEVSCYFSDSGVTFTSDIASNAQSLADYSYAGPGWNNYRSFKCYKDNGRVLYTSGDSTYYSIYYCLDA